MSIDFRRLEQILADAAARSNPAERAAFLAQACGDDREFRAEVERLLAAHEQAGDFLEAPMKPEPESMLGDRPGETKTPRDSDIVIERAGSMVGRYKLLEQIGEGGFGVVYMAEQVEPMQRKVALKIIKAGMDTREVIARFEAERQALAVMDHPNIAKVFDGGATASGRPFFVMELVKGVPITRYCDEHRLTPRERLDLFLPVCQAIQHAHQKGIIHRDVKPSNVLVAPYDGRPVPKVIDFGVAKAIGQRLTERTLFTGLGTLVGTLEYMSPEQAELNNQDIDTRSDIYSLGVLLYELLTGTPPLSRERLRQAAFTETLRLIREEEPPRPSTRLSESKDALPSISAQRHMEPAKLTKLVRGELDWIVLKALEKDRNRRYETANGLALDVQRYLADEPIEARRGSALYLVKKGLRRYRVPVAIAAGFVVMLACGLTLTSALYYRANRALTAEREQRELAQRKTDEALAARAAEDKARQAAERAREKSEHLLYVALVAAAQNEIKDNQLAKAAQTLAACPPAYRHWEWGWLSRMATVAVDLRTLRAHEGPVGTIAFSRDSRLLASGGEDGTARVWDVRTGQLLRTIRARCDSVDCVSFSPDGRWLLTCGPNYKDSADGAIQFWDAQTGELAREFRAHDQWVRTLAYSLDGKYLATGSDDKTAKLWDADTLEQRRTFAGHTGMVLSVAFSYDGKSLITNSIPHPRRGDDCSVRVLDVQDGSERYSILGILPKGVAADPQGRYLGLSVYGRVVRLAEIAGGQTARKLFLPFDDFAYQEAVPVAFNPSGTRIATGTEQGMLCMWDLASGEDIFTRKNAHTGQVHCLAFSGDGRVLASAGQDGLVRLWAMCSPAKDRAVSAHGSQLETLAFSPDGSRFAVGTLQGEIEVRDTRSGRLLCRSRIPGEDIGVGCVVFHPDGRQLAAACGDGLVRLWDTEKNRQLLTLGEGRVTTRAIAFSPDGKRLAIGSLEGDTAIWDAVTGQVVCKPQGGGGMMLSLAFSHDGTLLAGGAGGELVRVWDAHSGQLLYKLPHHVRAEWTVLFSPDDKLLFVGNLAGVCHVLESRTGKYVAMFDTGQPEMTAMAVSPDGRRLATCGGGCLRIWDTASWQPLVTLGVQDWYRWCSFSPNGRTLGVVGYNGLAILRNAFAWDARDYPGNEQASLEDRLEQYKRRWWLDRSPDSQYRDPAGFARADDLDRRSFDVVVAAGRTDQEYRKAYEQAEEACRLDPDNRDHLRTLGVALYRLGRYQEAVEELTASNQLTGGLPSATSFLAMAYHRLGQTAEASAAMRQLRTIVKYGKWVCRPDVQDCYRQALEELGEPSSEDEVPGLTQSAWELKFYLCHIDHPVWQEENWQAVIAGSPVAQSRAPFLRFRWGDRSPEPGVSPGFFATVATSSLVCEKAVRLRVCAVAHDGVRVWIDKQVVIDRFTEQDTACHRATVNLSAGRHSVRVEHFRLHGHHDGALIFWIEPDADPLDDEIEAGGK